MYFSTKNTLKNNHNHTYRHVNPSVNFFFSLFFVNLFTFIDFFHLELKFFQPITSFTLKKFVRLKHI